MQSEKLHLDDIRYNPEREGFEALVHIHEANAIYAYPVFTTAHLTADYKLIARRLTQKAQTLHDTPAKAEVRLRRAAHASNPKPSAFELLRRALAA